MRDNLKLSAGLKSAGNWAMLILVLLCACQPLESKQPGQNKKIAKLTEKALIDSVRKYSHLTEFLSQDDSFTYVLYGKREGDSSWGAVAITDSCLLVLQSVNAKMQLVSRASFPEATADFEEEDLNGDGKDEFIVYGAGNMHGQRRPYVFMKDKAELFQYRPDLSLYNVAYDVASKELITYYFGGAFSLHSKATYRWQGDSIKQVAGAEYDMCSGKIELYKLRNGKRCCRRLYRNHQDVVFDTALFQPNECY